MRNRRRLFSFLFVVGVLLVTTGCGLGGVGDGPQGPPPEGPSNGGGQPVYPPAVMDTLETVKYLHAGLALVEGDETFFIVSYGEQPTAGHQVEIVGIETEGGKAVVTARLTEPEEPAAQVLTHPYAVEVLEGVYRDVEFLDAGGEYFPQVRGWPGGPLDTFARSNNIIVSSFGETPGLIYAAGIARVFEATVGYQLQDACGEVLHEGFVTAAAGGPDWGYFEIEVADPPAGTGMLEVFQYSAKDGSRVDLVALPLDPGPAYG